MTETIIGLYKAELIHRWGHGTSKGSVELATPEWVAWFNHHKLMAPPGYVPPAELKASYHRNLKQQTVGV